MPKRKEPEGPILQLKDGRTATPIAAVNPEGFIGLEEVMTAMLEQMVHDGGSAKTLVADCNKVTKKATIKPA